MPPQPTRQHILSHARQVGTPAKTTLTNMRKLAEKSGHYNMPSSHGPDLEPLKSEIITDLDLPQSQK